MKRTVKHWHITKAEIRAFRDNLHFQTFGIYALAVSKDEKFSNYLKGIYK